MYLKFDSFFSEKNSSRKIVNLKSNAAPSADEFNVYTTFTNCYAVLITSSAIDNIYKYNYCLINEQSEQIFKWHFIFVQFNDNNVIIPDFRERAPGALLHVFTNACSKYIFYLVLKQYTLYCV